MRSVVVQSGRNPYAADVPPTPPSSADPVIGDSAAKVDTAPDPNFDYDLDAIERRLAAFDSATKRLAKTVSTVEPQPAAPTTASFHPSSDRNDIASGLRPAVAASAPTTGALARRSAGAPRPSFTSSYGRPQVAPTIPAPVRTPTAATRRPPANASDMENLIPQPSLPARRNRRWLWPSVVGFVGIAALGSLYLASSFPVCPEGVVVARTVAVAAPIAGILSVVSAPVGATVKAGDIIGRVDRPANIALGEPEHHSDVTAPVDGAVADRLVAVGRQVAEGEHLLTLALPNTAVVVASLPTSAANRVAIGDRVEVTLIADHRSVDGTVARVLAPGEQLDGVRAASTVADLRPQLVIDLDPAPLPAHVGQGVRVSVLGPRPGPVRLFLYRLRGVLPF